MLSATAPAQPLLEVEDLCVEFPTRRGTLQALDGVSFGIAPGEVLGVVGESGAGKSLLGAALIGLLPPPARIASGSIRLEGGRIDDLPESELRRIRGRRIGTIFQDPLTSLDPLFTVGAQLVETLRTHLAISAEDARRRAIEWLHTVGIRPADERVDHYPHQLSGGMRQRAVIALALCAEPRLVIADEPTTALDVSLQAQIVALLRRLCSERGAAVMLITHDMGVIAETTDRVAVMYAGRVVEIGATAHVLKLPRHPYTRALIACIPAIGERLERLAQIDGAMPRLDAPVPGCPFHPRCPAAFQRCREERPGLVRSGESRVACFVDGGSTVGGACP